MLCVMATASQIDQLCDGLASPQARAKYGSARELVRVSEQDPELLYPRFDFFAGLLSSQARILRWNAIRILGNLARADRAHRLEKMLDRYLAPIRGPEMIAAAQTMHGAAEIARAQPELADRIARAILGVSRARYATPECRQVAAGHAMRALDHFFDAVSDKPRVRRFVAAQLANPRPATRKKAEQFLRRHFS